MLTEIHFIVCAVPVKFVILSVIVEMQRKKRPTNFKCIVAQAACACSIVIIVHGTNCYTVNMTGGWMFPVCGNIHFKTTTLLVAMRWNTNVLDC